MSDSDGEESPRSTSTKGYYAYYIMSRFVSAGGSDAESRPLADNAAWVKAQQQVEALRKPKPKETTQEGGKSLYEVLEANKGRLEFVIRITDADSVLLTQ